MAIHFIYGVGGSGKTYYAVKHLLRNYFKFDKELQDYIKKKEFEDVKIITNIDQFVPLHENLDDWIRHAGGKDNFFSYDIQKKVFEKNGPVIYMIDEAHEYFPRSYKNESCFNWLSYHRHWGQTIYLMSQAYSRLPRQITDLIELTIYAMPPSSSLLGGKDLKYNVMSGREVIDKKALLKEQAVFNQYRSQHADQKEKTRNPLMKFVVGGVLVTGLLMYSGFNWYRSFFTHKEQEQLQAAVLPEKKTVVKEEKKNEVVPVERFTPTRLNWIKGKKGLFVIWENDIYTIKSFPYVITTIGTTDLIALIPKNHDTDQVPETKTKKVKNKINPYSRSRT